MMRVVGNSFETRLGNQDTRGAQQKSDEGSANGESEIECAPCASTVLVVVDANKEVSTHALDWAISYVVQKGDSVKLLGVLHHILNPSEFPMLGVVQVGVLVALVLVLAIVLFFVFWWC